MATDTSVAVRRRYPTTAFSRFPPVQGTLVRRPTFEPVTWLGETQIIGRATRDAPGFCMAEPQNIRVLDYVAMSAAAARRRIMI